MEAFVGMDVVYSRLKTGLEEATEDRKGVWKGMAIASSFGNLDGKVRGRKKKVSVVLGGAGFIGSHLADRLLRNGNVVIVIDNMEYCYADNLRGLELNERFEVIVADVNEELGGILRGWELYDYVPDEIYHLAGVVATGSFVSKPVEAYWTSVKPMDELLRYKRRHPEVKLLFASSSEVYGNAKKLPTPEEYTGNVSFDGARSGYDEGKRGGEALIAAYQREYGVGAARVRIFNTYGERMNATGGRLVPSMVRSALEHGVIEVAKPGTQKRTLLYVDDCVNGLVAAMDKQIRGSGVNIGGNETLMVREVAEMVAAQVDASGARGRVGKAWKEAYGEGKWNDSDRVELRVVDGYPHDIADRRPDITLAKERLGWVPKITFHDGLDRVILYWEKKLIGEIGRGELWEWNAGPVLPFEDGITDADRDPEQDG